MIKKVLTNSAIYGLAPHVPRIVSVLLLPIMTAHLTDVDYGIAGTIAAYTMALSALSTLGVSAYLQVNFFKAKYISIRFYGGRSMAFSNIGWSFFLSFSLWYCISPYQMRLWITVG